MAVDAIFILYIIPKMKSTVLIVLDMDGTLIEGDDDVLRTGALDFFNIIDLVKPNVLVEYALGTLSSRTRAIEILVNRDIHRHFSLICTRENFPVNSSILTKEVHKEVYDSYDLVIIVDDQPSVWVGNDNRNIVVNAVDLESAYSMLLNMLAKRDFLK